MQILGQIITQNFKLKKVLKDEKKLEIFGLKGKHILF